MKDWVKILISFIPLITAIITITLSKFLNHYFWLKRNEKVRSLEAENKKLKEDKKTTEKNKTNDKEIWEKLFKQLLREREKRARSEERERGFKDQIKQLENKEKELNSRLFQSETRTEQLENLAKKPRISELLLEGEAKYLKEKVDKLKNVNSKLRLKLKKYGIKEESSDLDDTPLREWWEKNKRQ